MQHFVSKLTIVTITLTKKVGVIFYHGNERRIFRVSDIRFRSEASSRFISGKYDEMQGQ